MAIEDTMAQLAHSQVSQSLPSLANDIQGFQLIESNEDNNSAIGVIVALISNLVDYIPAIWRKGKIYNMDIMYIPELRQWLPTQDNWVTYLKSRRADLEASIVDSQTTSTGAPGSVDLDIPLLKIVKTASQTKDAKYIQQVGIPAVLKEASAILKKQLSNPAEALASLDIPSAMDLLKKCASSEGAQKLVATISRCPEIADAFVQYYSDDEILDVARTVVEALHETIPVDNAKEGEVKVLTSASKESRDLSDVQKAEILRDGAVIVDTRGITPTKIYKTNKSSNNWCSPATNGVYELLQLDGSTVTAYVVVGPRYRDRRTREIVGTNYVIPLDDNMERRVIQTPAHIMGQILPTCQFNLTGGYSVDNIPTNYADTYLIIDIDGTAMEVKNLKPVYVGKGNETVIRADGGARITVPNNNSEAWQDRYPMHEGSKLTQLVKIPTGGRLRVKGTTLFVPEKSRVFRVNESFAVCCGDEMHGCNNNDTYQRKLNLATMDEFVDAVSRREKLLSIKIYNDAVGYVISDDKGNATDPLNKRAAAVELVKKYAIAPDTAKEMLSSVPLRGQERYLAKLAADANYMMAFSEQDPEKPTTASVDLNAQLDGDAKTILQQAGNSGVKEVMDVTVLKLLAEDGSSVRMIQDMIPKLFSAMNAVGQILFMLRASTSMTEAYGEYRADEMEKQFTKLMQRLGDAVIVLQQGRVDDVKDLLEGPLSSTLG